MKVYEYDERIDAILNSNADWIDEETGEVFDPERLAALFSERNDKLENLLLYTAQLEADAEELRRYAADRTELARSKEAQAARMKDWLLCEITRYGDTRFESARIRGSIRTTPVVKFTDESLLPPEYVTVKTEKKPDKNAIKAAIKAGTLVPGAELVGSQSLSIK